MMLVILSCTQRERLNRQEDKNIKTARHRKVIATILLGPNTTFIKWRLKSFYLISASLGILVQLPTSLLLEKKNFFKNCVLT